MICQPKNSDGSPRQIQKKKKKKKENWVSFSNIYFWLSGSSEKINVNLPRTKFCSIYFQLSVSADKS